MPDRPAASWWSAPLTAALTATTTDTKAQQRTPAQHETADDLRKRRWGWGAQHTYYVLAGATPVLVHNCNNEATHDVGNVVDNLDNNVYFHYTSEEGHAGILKEDGSLRIAANDAGKVHVTQEIGSPAEIEQNIFIGSTRYSGKADYVFAFRMPEGVELGSGSQGNELIARGSLKIPAENVLFHGRNPF